MKLSIDLEDAGSYEESVAEAIRGEILTAIRNRVRAEIKQQDAEIKAGVKRAVTAVIKDLQASKVQEIAQRMIREL